MKGDKYFHEPVHILSTLIIVSLAKKHTSKSGGFPRTKQNHAGGKRFRAATANNEVFSTCGDTNVPSNTRWPRA